MFQDTATPPALRRWLSQDEAAAYLGITTRTLRRMVARGDLPGYRMGPRLTRFDRAELDALMQRIPAAGGAASA